LKILLVHSYYHKRGGEDEVFEQEYHLLKTKYNVERLYFKNHIGLKGGIQFLMSIWNFLAARKLEKAIRRFKPTVVHMHNLHFSSGPLLIRVAKKYNIPTVVTLHNYRLLCPSGTLSYNGRVFTKSLRQKFPWTAIRLKVYRNSYFQSFYLAFITWFHKKIGTWDMVNCYVVLSDAAITLFHECSKSFVQEKMIIKPNFVKRIEMESSPRNERFLYIGRLSEEKGIHVLLNAFSRSDFFIDIAGDGDLKHEVEQASARFNNINFLGSLNKAQVLAYMKDCTALIVPSIWYEPFGLVTVEAFVSGTAVIANNLGAMSSMIIHGYNGMHYDGSSEDLLQKLGDWLRMPEFQKDKLREGAMESYKRFYTPETNLEKLMTIYEVVKNNETNRN